MYEELRKTRGQYVLNCRIDAAFRRSDMAVHRHVIGSDAVTIIITYNSQHYPVRLRDRIKIFYVVRYFSLPATLCPPLPHPPTSLSVFFFFDAAAQRRVRVTLCYEMIFAN